MLDNYYEGAAEVEELYDHRFTEPDLATGIGRCKYRPPDKVKSYSLKKQRVRRKIAKKSKQRNR